jgi:hypothetical protein
MTDARTRILDLLRANPSLTVADLVETVGVTRQRVHQILSKEGLRAAPQRPAVILPRVPRERSLVRTVIQPVSVDIPPSSLLAATIGELLVAADLMARRWQVFYPLARSTTFDLIASSKAGDRVLRIEVRCVRRNKEGCLPFPKKASPCDHYALVAESEPITYRPELPSAL